MRRALREGERVRRTERNEARADRAGVLLRRSQLTCGAGLICCPAELDAAEVDRALRGCGRATGMHPMGIMAVGGMNRGGARLLDAPRHGSPRERAQREARRENRGQAGAEHGFHAVNVAAEWGRSKLRVATRRGSRSASEPPRDSQGTSYGMNCRLLPGRLPPITSILGCPLRVTRLPARPVRAPGSGA